MVVALNNDDERRTHLGICGFFELDEDDSVTKTFSQENFRE